MPQNLGSPPDTKIKKSQSLTAKREFVMTEPSPGQAEIGQWLKKVKNVPGIKLGSEMFWGTWSIPTTDIRGPSS